MRRTLLFGALWVLCWVGAIAQTASPGAPPPESHGGEATRPVQPAPETGAKETGKPASYILQCGDELEIRVYDLPDLSAVVGIRPDGKISVPLQTDLKAAGLTAAQLTDAITA